MDGYRKKQQHANKIHFNDVSFCWDLTHCSFSQK